MRRVGLSQDVETKRLKDGRARQILSGQSGELNQAVFLWSPSLIQAPRSLPACLSFSRPREKKNMFIPDDVIALVLCRFDLIGFCAAASTCRTWHEAARKKMAWPQAVGSIRLAPRTARLLSATVWAACPQCGST
jgi:hypothetical protein